LKEERKHKIEEGEEGREEEKKEPEGMEGGRYQVSDAFITFNPSQADLLRPLSLASFGRSSTRCAASVKSSHSAPPLGSMADAICGSSAARQGPSV